MGAAVGGEGVGSAWEDSSTTGAWEEGQPDGTARDARRPPAGLLAERAAGPRAAWLGGRLQMARPGLGASTDYILR